jgi:hypothetical protein
MIRIKIKYYIGGWEMLLNFFKGALALTVASFIVIFFASSAFAEPLHQQIDLKVNQPPKDFIAVNASEDDLHKYGLPKRPNDPQELAIWNEHMKHAKNFIYP